MHPDAEDTYVARPLRCHACLVRANAAENWEGRGAGMYWAVDREA